MHVRVGLLLAVVTQLGCATILTGTKQKVKLDSAPTEAFTLAVGGTVGQVVRYAKKGDDVTRFLLEQLRPHVSAEDYQRLSGLDISELITRVVAASKTQYESPELQQLRSALAMLPPPVLEALYEKIGIAAVAFTPSEVELKKGSPYAVLIWRDGYQVGLATIDAHFNWVVLLNVLTLGLGVPVDILTGAWLNLSPTQVQVTLEGGPPPAPTEPPAPPVPEGPSPGA